MTLRQRLLKFFYPVIIVAGKFKKMNEKFYKNDNNIQPVTTVYDIPLQLNNGNTTDLSEYKNKKILIVNTASNCGYTNQYEDLQKLYEQQSGELVIVGFPSNNFREQEKGTDSEIAQFCKVNYGVTCPLQKNLLL